MESNRDFPNSILYYKKYIKLKDSITSIFQEEKVAELTALYESEKKAKEFEILQQKTQIQNLELGQKNAWIIILLVVMILGIVAVLVSLRINRLRADHKIMDLRQKVLLTQMNPHFLFNSLTAIQSFILDDKNDKRCKLVYLTEKGRALGAAYQKKYIKEISTMLEALGEHDAKEHVRIIKRIYNLTINGEISNGKR